VKSLDQMIEGMHAHARATLIGKNDEQILPFFHIQFKDRPDAVMATPWGGEREKSAMIAAIRASLKEFRKSVVNYAFVSEVWVAEYDHKPGQRDLMPSERETRREMVIVSAGDHTDARMRMWEIIRDDKGVVTDLVEDADMTPDHFEGRLHDLLAED
jgi:hypothetical protein